MGGAMGLDPKNLEGRLLINIDSEEEGKLLVSCAGGVRETISLPIERSSCSSEVHPIPYKLKIRGLKGGHSGAEIDRGRGNSNKLMGRVLQGLSLNYSLVSINGGSKSNAIPREMDAVILIAAEDANSLREELKAWQETFKNEYKISDPNISLTAEPMEANFDEVDFDKVFSKATAEKAVKLLCLIPNGIQTMSMDIAGLVQSSTNLGVVTTTAEKVLYQSAVRSSVKSLKEDILVTSKIAAEALGAAFETQSDYPAWQYDADSKLRKVFEQVYKKLYGADPEIMALHAGVECGLFKEKFGAIDMISFGPDLYDVHTPEEHMSISSVKNTWEYLIEVLKTLK
jgi:dipeptidase D